MQNKIFSEQQIATLVDELKITDLSEATIGQAALLAMRLEETSGIPFIRMDQGVPGLEPCRVGLEAEKKALDSGVAAIYPAAAGIPQLKNETARFVKAFLDIEVSPKSCIPVTGSVAGSFGSFIITSQCSQQKDTVLFIDPGFPIQKSQLKILGVNYEQFDIHDFRGAALKDKIESYLKKGNIAAIIFSNPNNPAWICLDEEELKIIGTLATYYDVIILEDLAYFCMDFRKDLGKPFEAPFPATVARYTQNYMLFISASKIFSYAGQRMAVVVISDTLFDRHYEALAKRYSGTGHFGNTFVNSILYMITSGVTHTTQFGVAEMFKVASDGDLNFVENTSEYARRAERMKRSFLANGFNIVYDYDVNEQIGDGFFFTIGYKSMSSGELMRELFYYGISSIPLNTTGSEQQGIRACTSRMTPELYRVLDSRLKAFRDDHI